MEAHPRKISTETTSKDDANISERSSVDMDSTLSRFNFIDENCFLILLIHSYVQSSSKSQVQDLWKVMLKPELLPVQGVCAFYQRVRNSGVLRMVEAILAPFIGGLE